MPEKIKKTREERLNALRGRTWTVSLGFVDYMCGEQAGTVILHGREVVDYYESIREGAPDIGKIGALNGSDRRVDRAHTILKKADLIRFDSGIQFWVATTD